MMKQLTNRKRSPGVHVPRSKVRLRAVAAIAGVLFLAQLGVAVPAEALSQRLHVIDLNACDQYQRSGANAKCFGTAPNVRAKAIISSIGDFNGTNIVTLQEVCRSTFDGVLRGLSSSWRAYFYTTVNLTDNRCLSPDRTWGLAIFALGTPFTSVSALPLGSDPSGERRALLCGTTTIRSTFRVCSSHLAPIEGRSADWFTANRTQFNAMRGSITQSANAGAALLLGADLNRDVSDCSLSSTVTLLQPLYRGIYGGGTSGGCATGTGAYYEADHYTSGGDGVYDEDTLGVAKIDYVLFNYQRFYADYGGDATSSTVSDHDPLRAAMTVHD